MKFYAIRRKDNNKIFAMFLNPLVADDFRHQMCDFREYYVSEVRFDERRD